MLHFRDEILDCARREIRNALNDWEEVADIHFQELPENSDSDIQFYVAAIFQSAVAYPNYAEDPCKTLSGDVIFDANSREKFCKGFYINALHEIGHVFGIRTCQFAKYYGTWPIQILFTGAARWLGRHLSQPRKIPFCR